MTGSSDNLKLILAEATTDEVEAAQEWLMGNREQEPKLWALAHTVNGYLRAGEAGLASNRWVEERLPRLKSKESVAEFKTQELLDLLFLFCRKERFCDGTLDVFASEIDDIRQVIRERVAETVSRKPS